MTMKDQPAPNSIRTYDSDGYRQRAAAVCVKDDKGEEVSKSFFIKFFRVLRGNPVF